ncbi:hypothetical protein, partial [Streptomyces sp. NPDC058745]|uniref:hypothetical protein n=1 Tax=Streptomyces sp. NPDC058745 TaxID=3346621 RepID=UPI0036B14A6F
MGGATVLGIVHYADLTGTDSPVANALPLLIPVAACAGLGRALWLRGSRSAAWRHCAQPFGPPLPG